MISELFWQCGIFLHDFGTVLTVWYFSTWFRNCFDSVVFPTWFPDTTLSEQFRNHVEIYHTFRIVQKWCRKQYTVRTVQKSYRKYYTVRTVQKSYTVLTVWYFFTWFRNCSDSVVFPTWFLNCSVSVVFPPWFLNTVPKSCRKIPHCQNSSEIM
jgi:hypothetical protein